MAGIALTGLASGLDTDSMVTQLVAAESAGRAPIALQQTQAQKRVSVLQGIQTKLNTLQSANQALQSVVNWIPTQTATSSDSSVMTATRTGAAGAGSYTVNVLSLASSAQKSFDYTAPTSDSTMTFGSTSINISAGASIDDAVNAINQAGGSVVAVNAAGKLVVSSTTTGSASTFNYSGDSLSLSSQRDGKDATYNIDGGATQSSPTNQVTGGIPGVDLTLSKVGSTGLTVSTPGPDAASLTAKMKAFVDAYNDVVTTTRAAITEQPVKNATTTSDQQKGTLFGDSGLNTMLDQLRSSVGKQISGLTGGLSSMSDLGITTGAASGSATYSNDSVAGKLVFDSTKFQAALTANPQGVRELLGAKTGTAGFSQSFNTVLTPQTTSGMGIDDRITQQGVTITRLTKSLSDFDARIDAYQTTLRAQFAAMEAALESSKSMQASLTSQLASLSNSNS
ncbi:MAG: flagellar filament capping protein FliD [Solirubrobacteraceae bacterium]|nr:flagellar filament capping protein FliD [Patulibacter sp.]